MERNDNAHTHTLQTRIAHWTNAGVVAFLVWTGFSMFGGDRHFASVRLLPAAFWQTFHFAGTKRQLFSWHVYAGVFFGINGTIYVARLLATGEWRRILRADKQWEHDPARPLDYSIPQRVAYCTVFVGAALMVLTGAALWFKHQIPWLLAALGGERFVLPVHVVLATALLAFVVVHSLQVVRAGLPTLRSMMVGEGTRRRAAFAQDYLLRTAERGTTETRKPTEAGS